uniref:Uncharacterized protein n=1 Tax=Globisporangium ultimum (strain ATCC 200006 / CBS 805.95 / DAOM BR144) TaxID=431595 RepID=K3WPI8_GLOUD
MHQRINFVYATTQWALHFEASKRRQRIGMRVVALVFVLGVAFIFSVLCANVVFVAKCSSIGKLVQAFTDSMSENSNATVANRIQVTNRFTRGAVVVTPSSNAPAGQMLLDIYGSK